MLKIIQWGIETTIHRRILADFYKEDFLFYRVVFFLVAKTKCFKINMKKRNPRPMWSPDVFVKTDCGRPRGIAPDTGWHTTPTSLAHSAFPPSARALGRHLPSKNDGNELRSTRAHVSPPPPPSNCSPTSKLRHELHHNLAFFYDALKSTTKRNDIEKNERKLFLIILKPSKNTFYSN